MNDFETRQIEEYEPGQTFGISQDAFRKPSLAYMMWLVLAGLFSLGMYLASRGLDWAFSTKIATFFGLFLCIVHFFRVLYLKPRNYFAPDLLFLAAYALFHFGYLALWAVNIVPPSTKIFFYPALYPKTMFIVNLGIVGFIFGYEIAAKRRTNNRVYTIKIPTSGWLIAGLLLMLLWLIVFVGYIMAVGLEEFVAKGAAVVAHMERYIENPRLWKLKGKIFSLGFGVYIVSVALRHGRLFKGKIGLSLFAFYMFTAILAGGRTTVVVTGMIILVVRHYLMKPIKLRWLILLAICFMFIFKMMAIVRLTTAFHIGKIMEEVKYVRETRVSHWYDPFIETGGSVRTINLTISMVPDEQPFWYGWSYLQSAVHVIPYLQGRLAHILGAGPSKWLTVTVFGPRAAGTGFTLAGEGYLNFGFVGAFFQLFLIGVVMRRIYVWFVSSLSPSSAVIFFVSLGTFIISVRNETDVLLQPLSQIVIFASLLNFLLGTQKLMPLDLDYDQTMAGDYLEGEPT